MQSELLDAIAATLTKFGWGAGGAATPGLISAPTNDKKIQKEKTAGLTGYPRVNPKVLKVNHWFNINYWRHYHWRCHWRGTEQEEQLRNNDENVPGRANMARRKMLHRHTYQAFRQLRRF
jgi:hypothetical protein